MCEIADLRGLVKGWKAKSLPGEQATHDQSGWLGNDDSQDGFDEEVRQARVLVGTI